MEIPDLSNLDLPEKEQKILESAIKVFTEKGFSAATTSEIAKNAGISEGTIFRYFKTKKDILRGILIHTLNIISEKLLLGSIEKILQNTDNKDMHSILKEVLYDRLKLVEYIFPMARIILTEALYHDDVRDALYENIIAKAISMIDGFRQRMVEKGLMRSDIEPESFLRAMIGNLAFLVIQNKFFADKFGITDIDKELDKLIDIILYGVASDREYLNSKKSDNK